MCIRDRLIARLPERDLVLIGGPEPNYRWQEYTNRLVSMVRSVQPELVVLLGALLTDAPVSYTHLRAHETVLDLVCRLLLEKKQDKRSVSATRGQQ